MAIAPDQPDRYRREAEACVELAERISTAPIRARLLEIAQRWLELALKAERRGSTVN
jgi:hypothetical protein